MIDKYSKLREVRIAGHRLVTWDTGLKDWRGQSKIGYCLSLKGKTIFEGCDFAGSPLDCDDSDETIKGLFGFLTCKPGDTDEEYFKDYTPEQLAWCAEHAETLSCAVYDRFGWE